MSFCQDEDLKMKRIFEFAFNYLATNIIHQRFESSYFNNKRLFIIRRYGEESESETFPCPGPDRLEVNVGKLEVRDSRGSLVLGAERGAVTVGADNLVVASPAGASFTTAVQTPLVKSPPSKPLTYFNTFLLPPFALYSKTSNKTFQLTYS